MISPNHMRSKVAPKRIIVPYVRYKSADLSKFINHVMRRGKKSTAEGIVYRAMALIEEKSQQKPLEVFIKAMSNASPSLEVRSRRVGGSNYQIPFPVRPERKFYLASNWIIEAARAKKGRPMHEKLAQELMEASQEQGSAMKKKQDVARMAEANKAFAHFAKFSR